jgi:dCTP diphosphatase
VTSDSASGSEPTLTRLQNQVLQFAVAREWLQFHNPRYLAEALIVEAGELLQCFQWKSDDACMADKLDPSLRASIESELADVLLYAINLANALDVNAHTIVLEKLRLNESRFPSAPSRE